MKPFAPPWRAMAGGAAALLVAASMIAPAGAQSDAVTGPDAAATDLPDPVTVQRVAGADRVLTAIAVSERAFPTGATTAVLVRSDDPADALVAGPLAAAVDGPLLLTERDAVRQAVLDELTRLGVTDVLVVGGTGAVADAVLGQLTDAGFTPERIAGDDRFATTVAVADRLVGESIGGTVFVVEGLDADPLRGWPDAVGVTFYASFLERPIFLVDTDVAPSAVLDRLGDLAPDEIVVIGGTAAVSAEVEETLAGLANEPDVRRLAGENRHATSGAIVDEAVTRGVDVAVRWVHTGASFADALTAGAAAGARGEVAHMSPVDADNPALLDRLRGSWDLLTEVVIVGGTAAVSEAGETAITDQVTAPELPAGELCLTVLHNNDGESKLLNPGSGLEDFGGAARFATAFAEEAERALVARDGCTTMGLLKVTSGDNFLAGKELNASLDKGVPFYDSILLAELEYDAIDLGNHDFDLGPAVTGDLIEGTRGLDADATFLSANLDFTDEPELSSLAGDGTIAPSTQVTIGGQQVGVIGLTTPTLASISSPGPNIGIEGLDADGDIDLQALADIVNAEVDRMATEDGVDVVVLISHLQGVDSDLGLVPLLDGVDIVVAGGGDEVLATPGDLLVPGDEAERFGDYPLYADGVDDLPVVTSAGSYKYVGRLVTRFDADGALVAVDDRMSRMVRVAGGTAIDAVAPDPTIQAQVTDPVQAYVDDLETTVIATTTEDLDGVRARGRTQETNLGSLLADSFVDAAQDRAADFGLDASATFVGLANGGGIRNTSIIEAGPITAADTFDTAPFGNQVVVIEDVTVAQLDALLEHAYDSELGEDNEFPTAGKFAQVGNLRIDVDRTQPGGDRVSNIRTYDGTPLADGFSIVTVDFLANGGDGYPYADLGLDSFTAIGRSYQQSLEDYLVQLGTVGDAGYPAAGGYPEILTPPTNAQRIVFTDL